MKRSSLLAVVLGLGMVGAIASPTFAQDAGNPPAQGGQGGGRGGFGGGQRMSPEQRREQRMTQMKQDLGASDDEWKVLQPKIEKVQQAQMQSMAGRFGGFGGRGGRGPGGDNANRPSSPAAAAAEELRTLLENKDATPEQIKAKLTALRDARAKAKEQLTAAQAELKDVLTQRQEAVLVSMGMLD